MVTFVKAANMLPEEQMDLTCNSQPLTFFSSERQFSKLDSADYIAQTTYWTLIEASLAIISACLPTLRPLFQGFSVESVIRSFRSVISLGSIRSRHSNGSKHGDIDSMEYRKESSSSMVGPHETVPAHHGAPVTANEATVYDRPGSLKAGKERITVQRSFVARDEAV